MTGNTDFFSTINAIVVKKHAKKLTIENGNNTLDEYTLCIISKGGSLEELIGQSANMLKEPSNSTFETF